jgi:hypothetical protein
MCFIFLKNDTSDMSVFAYNQTLMHIVVCIFVLD